ncbi:hypothetical protein [Streptomyces atriruber]|uniref:hypothetical protein n=1 Tax=Streptomyces atriruber TaxID=545121 RepID=UPI0006E1CDCC|nr:hypothetical protein [Streptomyces atriruber]
MKACRGTDIVGTLLIVPRLVLRAAGAGLDTVVREVLAAVVRRVELDDVVSRVDVDRVVERVDVDRVVERVDVDRIVSRVDVNHVVRRVDVDRVVERVDVDAIARRLDIDAVIARIDLVTLVVDVLAEIDVQYIAREAGSGMTRETVEAVRERGIRADQLVGRFADRLLRRAGDERAGAPPPYVRPV